MRLREQTPRTRQIVALVTAKPGISRAEVNAVLRNDPKTTGEQLRECAALGLIERAGMGRGARWYPAGQAPKKAEQPQPAKVVASVWGMA